MVPEASLASQGSYARGFNYLCKRGHKYLFDCVRMANTDLIWSNANKVACIVSLADKMGANYSKDG